MYAPRACWRQLAAAVPQPLLRERSDGDVPAGRSEAVLSVTLDLAQLQEHLGTRAP
jgi:hypothetical protein